MTTRSDLLLPAREVPAAPPQLSTYWMPLDEPTRLWAAFGAEADDDALTLKATAHAFFALAHETQALRHFSLACEQQQRRLFTDYAGYWYAQAERALFEATHHWSRAAYQLDSLALSDFPCPQDGLAEARRMTCAARAQQERLWKLTDEVRDAITAWRRQQEITHAAAQSSAPHRKGGDV